jgi:hypothetical protein
MVERVREFYNRYPESRFLASLVEPVREVKADHIDKLFEQNQVYSAISYFEKTRDLLYKDLNDERKKRLFVAYIDTYQADKAAEFWPEYKKLTADDDLKKLRSAVFLAEIAAAKPSPAWTNANRSFALELAKHKWTTKAGKQSRQYLYRTLAATTQTSSGANHLGWAFELVKSWAQTDRAAYCSDVYPVLSKMIHEPKQHSVPLADLRKETLAMVDKLLPGLLAIDETCGISFLELEFELLEETPAELGRRYLTRREWRLSRPLTTLFWEVAEKNSNRGQSSIAQEMWSIIRDKAPSDAPEVGFAKVRLDPSRTEYEQLWK